MRHATTSLLSPPVASLRASQRDEIRTLERVLVRLEADESDVRALQDAVTSLDSIFLICTVGEFNAGKSSLINALLAHEHCKTGVLPTTAAITLLGEPASAAAVDDGGVVTQGVREAASWLQDVSIVDTPGTNTLDASHTTLTRDFVPRADVLLFVTSSERPYSESEQAFLRQIKQWGKKVAFVVNKADLLPSANDLKDVVSYVESNARSELGKRVPVFPVSARTALTLKQRAAESATAGGVGLGTDLSAVARDEAEAAAALQWGALEAHVLTYVKSDARAVEKLHSQLSLALAVLGRCEVVKRKAAAQVAADVEVIAEARRRLDVWESETRGEFEAQRARLRLVWHGLSQRGTEFLQEELQLSQMMRLAFGREKFVRRFEESVLADADDALQHTAAAIAAWMEQKGASQARSTAELLSARLARLPSAEPSTQLAEVPDGVYHSQRHQLLLQLQGSGRSTMERFDAKAAAERMGSAAQSSLAQAALLNASAAGVTSLVAVKAAALVDLTGLLPAALLAATGLGLLPMQRYRLQQDLVGRVGDISATLDRAVLAHLEAELISSKGRCTQLVTPFSTLVGSAHTLHEEQLAALTASREALEALAQEAKGLGGTTSPD